MRPHLRSFIFMLLSLSTMAARAVVIGDSSRISIYGRNFVGRVLTTNEERSSNWYMAYDVAVGFDTRRDSSTYARAYNYPTWGVGISVSRFSSLKFHNTTFMPDVYTVYASFHRELMSKRRFTIGYNWETGMTSSPTYYDPVNNPSNFVQSSFVMVYFGGGFYGTYALSNHWDLGMELTYRHHSNGKLSLPNTGIDILGASVFVRYALADREVRTKPKVNAAEPFKKHFIYHLSVGGGIHSCDAEWTAYNTMVSDPAEKRAQFAHYPKITFGADMMYRSSLKHATGLALDLTYSTNMRQLEEAERIIYGDERVNEGPGYSPLSVGVGLVQEMFWKNFSGYLSVGMYAYKQQGIREDYGLFYQKAGGRYYISALDNAFIGLNIKANRFVAEFLELSIGKRF